MNDEKTHQIISIKYNNANQVNEKKKAKRVELKSHKPLFHIELLF